MKPRTLALGAALLFMLGFSSFPNGLAAQSLWGTPPSPKSINLEIARPFFDGDGWDALSSVTFLSVNWPFTGKLSFVGELPLAYGGWDTEYEKETDFAIGNPYVGLSIGEEESNVFGQIGVRLPLVTDPDDNAASAVGFVHDMVGRTGAFFPDMVPVTGTVTFRSLSETGILAQALLGADTWISTTGDGDGIEAFGLYGARVGYEGDALTILGGIAGRAVLTEDEWIGGGRTTNEFRLDVGYHGAKVQPTVYVRVPLDEEIRDYMNVLVGVGLRFAF